MTTPAPRLPVSRVIAPRSIALIGASESLEKFGGRILHNAMRHGYQGRLLPINPHRETLLGLKAYPSVADAPGPIDLAVIAVPASQLLETVRACAEAGVGACIVVTAQMAEFDAAGAALQDQAVAIARAQGMRLVGPNCMGFINAHAGLGLTSSMTIQHVPSLIAGGVGLVSQSGALMATLFIHAHELGIGVSSMVSVGNQADLELTDFFEVLVDDPDTTTICLYVEGLKRPDRFIELGLRAVQAGKTVLAVKAGRTEAGHTAARSHTASLAGSYSAFAAACRSAGVVLMDEPEAMIAVAGMLDKLGPFGPGGIGLVVSSGGGGAVTADRLSEAGLPLAVWTPDTRTALESHFLPTHVNNPIDLGAHKGALGPHVFADTLDAAIRDPGVAVLAYIMTPQPMMAETTAGLIRAHRETGKPVAVVYDTASFAPEITAQALAGGLPVVRRIDDLIRVLDAGLRLRDLRSDLARPAPQRPSGFPLASGPGHGALDEPGTKALLSSIGLAVPADGLASTVDDALAVAARIGYPVVMKGVSDTIVHKSDAGLVHLDLVDQNALRQAFAAIAQAMPVGEPMRVSVQKMVRGEAELIIGARHDDGFGPQVVVGFGGVLVELLGDVQTALAPIAPWQAEAMLRRLRLWPVLDGYRGRSRLDVAAVVDAIVRVSWLAAELGPRLRELDVNPLLVMRAGQGAIALDARATLS